MLSTSRPSVAILAAKAISTAVYLVVGVWTVVEVLDAVGPTGDRVEIGTVYIDLARWSAFFTIVPAALLLIAAVLAFLDTAPRPAFRVYAIGPLFGWVLSAAGLVFGALALVLAFYDSSPAGVQLQESSRSTATEIHASQWFAYTFCAVMFSYFSVALFARIRPWLNTNQPGRGPELPAAWLTHFTAGVIPTAVLALTAWLLFA